MSGRNRVYIGIAALILLVLALIVLVSVFGSVGSPQPDVNGPTRTPVVSPSATLEASPSPTPRLEESVTDTSEHEASETPESILPAPTATHEPDSGDEPTETPAVQNDSPSGTQISSTEVIEAVTAAAAAQATLFSTISGGGAEFTQTPPPTPIEVAFAPILIRSNVSGNVIGDGTLRVYAPSSVQAPQTVRVELELNLDNLYITPTPQGNTGTPVPRSTQLASPTGATPTPFAPIVTDLGLPIYQRMGATLLCAVQSFSGCDGQRDPTQAKLITSEKTSWSWILRPAEGATGIQDLRIEVWITQLNLDGQIEYLDIPDAQYPFIIEIAPPSGISPFLLAVIAVAVVLIAAVGFIWNRGRSTPQPAPVAAAKIPIPGSTHAPLVFISYRRGSSWGQARSIEQSLRKRGANVFIDVDDINEGKFAETIQQAIADCDFFLPVLAPGTLESIWVRREIAHAISLKKTIVPLLVDGFTLDESNVPPDIAEIASHNAIRVLPEFYEEAMDRLAKRFLRLE